MPPASRRPVTTAVLALLAWTGLVLWRYQAVQSPEPLAGVALIAAWLVVFTLAALGGGRLVCRCVAFPMPGSLAAVVIELALGAGVLAGVAGALGAVSLLRPLPLLAALLALAGVGAASLRGGVSPRWARLPRALRLPALLVAGAGVLTLLTAVTPSPFYDQLHYHLAFPFQWLRHGRIEVFPREAYSFFPATIGLLYTYALAALGAGAAQAVHWWTGALAVAGAGALGTALRGPRAGWWAAAVLASTPAVMLLATWAAADLAIVAFVIAALLMLLLAGRDLRLAASPAWWVLVGALAGLAAGCKYLAVLTAAAPLALAVVLAPVAAGGVRRLPRLLLAGAGGALSFGPWLARNVLATGNPVYPFLSGVFPSAAGPGGADLAEVAAKIPGIGWSHPGLADILSLTTFHPTGDAGAIGPAYLALVPAAAWAAWRGRHTFAVVLAAVWVAAMLGWAAGPPTGRYLLPAVAVLVVLAGAGVQRVLAAAPRRARPWVTGMLAVVLAWSALGGTTPLELARMECTLGRGNVDEIMTRYASYWPAVRVLDRELPATAKVLLVGESRTMYIDRDVVVDDPFITPLLATLAEAAPTAPAIAAELRRAGVTHVLFNRHEAARIAALNQRAEYFAPLSPAGRARLDEFLGRCLRPVVTAGPVELLALGGCSP